MPIQSSHNAKSIWLFVPIQSHWTNRKFWVMWNRHKIVSWKNNAFVAKMCLDVWIVKFSGQSYHLWFLVQPISYSNCANLEEFLFQVFQIFLLWSSLLNMIKKTDYFSLIVIYIFIPHSVCVNQRRKTFCTKTRI